MDIGKYCHCFLSSISEYFQILMFLIKTKPFERSQRSLIAMFWHICNKKGILKTVDHLRGGLETNSKVSVKIPGFIQQKPHGNC